MPALTRAGDDIEHDAEKEKQAQERTRKKLLFLQTAGGVSWSHAGLVEGRPWRQSWNEQALPHFLSGMSHVGYLTATRADGWMDVGWVRWAERNGYPFVA